MHILELETADRVYMDTESQAAFHERPIDIIEAQDRLEELIEKLKPGEWFVIAVNDVPKVRVVALWPHEADALKRAMGTEAWRDSDSHPHAGTGPAEADPVGS